MYAVTKGTDSVPLDTAHCQVVHAAKEAGLQVITLIEMGIVHYVLFSGGFTIARDQEIQLAN